MVNLRQLFFPTKETQIERYERLIELMQEQKGQCTTCKWLIEPDPYLPGFVTDYGRCGKEQVCFAAKVCNLEPFECESYEYNDGEEFYYRKQIERIKEEMEK